MLNQATMDQIRAEARELHPLRTLLLILAGLLFGLGWVAAKVLRVLWAAVAWSAAAVKVGWRAGMGRD
jgi:hypothetical protein